MNDMYKNAFCDMFAVCCAELDRGFDARLADEHVIPELLKGLLRIDLIEDDGVLCGFCIYRIDGSGNGDIREIYIRSDHRRKGLGKFLLFTAEMRLKEAGAEELHTLSDECACGFFSACGYEIANEAREIPNRGIFFKKLAGRGCRGQKKD